MAITSSDTTASQGASASAGAGGTAASASASGGASSSAQPSVSGPAAQQLIVRPPLDVYKKLAIVRLPDDEVMYQNADGSWGKVKNLDETRVVNNKKKDGDKEDDEDDAEMTDEADDGNKSEVADDEKKEDGSEEVSRCEVDCQKAPSSIYLRISVVFCCC